MNTKTKPISEMSREEIKAAQKNNDLRMSDWLAVSRRLAVLAARAEHRAALARAWREKAGGGVVGRGEGGDKLGPDLVGGLADAGPQRGANVARRRAEPDHGRDRRLDDAAERALPAGVSGADHAGAGIGEQNHAAIGAGDAERETGRRSDDADAARPSLGRERPFQDGDIRRVDLIRHGEPIRRDAERERHADAIGRHAVGRIARANAAVQRGVDAPRHAAPAREERVRQPRRIQQRRSEMIRSRHVVSNPGRRASERLAIAIALNSAPISLSPLPVRRRRAISNSSARSGARSASALARVGRPSSRRKSP